MLATGSKEEAQQWVATDPAVQAGRFVLEFQPYTPRIRSICKEGALLVLPVDFPEAKIQNDPTLKDDLFVATLKKL